MLSTNDFNAPLKKLGIALDKTVLEKCKALCDMYSVTAQSLVDQLDAFLSNDGMDQLSLQNFAKFEQAVRINNTKVSSCKCITACVICIIQMFWYVLILSMILTMMMARLVLVVNLF